MMKGTREVAEKLQRQTVQRSQAGSKLPVPGSQENRASQAADRGARANDREAVTSCPLRRLRIERARAIGNDREAVT